MQRDCIITRKRGDNMPIIPSGETWAKERDLMYDWKRNNRNERRTMTYHHDRRLLFRSRDWEAGMGVANEVAVGHHLPGRRRPTGGWRRPGRRRRRTNLASERAASERNRSLAKHDEITRGRGCWCDKKRQKITKQITN